MPTMSNRTRSKKNPRDPEGTSSGDDTTEMSHTAQGSSTPARPAKHPDLSDVLALMQQQIQQQQLQMQQQQENFHQLLRDEKEHRRLQQEMHEANHARAEKAAFEAQRQQALQLEKLQKGAEEREEALAAERAGQRRE